MASTKTRIAPDSARDLHELIGDDATATFESDPKFLDSDPTESASSGNVAVQRDTDDLEDSDEEDREELEDEDEAEGGEDEDGEDEDEDGEDGEDEDGEDVDEGADDEEDDGVEDEDDDEEEEDGEDDEEREEDDEDGLKVMATREAAGRWGLPVQGRGASGQDLSRSRRRAEGLERSEKEVAVNERAEDGEAEDKEGGYEDSALTDLVVDAALRMSAMLAVTSEFAASM